MPEHRHFLPAAGHDWLLFLYDPLQALMGGSSLRRAMLDDAGIQPGHRILDVGCGTGSLVVQLLEQYPDAQVTGLDPDSRALARARRKAARAGVSPVLDRGFSDALPYPDASFDRVFSSFVFHHLQPEEQEKTLVEIRRVLRPGGAFHLLDFGRASERTDVAGRMGQTGFAATRDDGARRSLFGRVAYLSAQA